MAKMSYATRRVVSAVRDRAGGRQRRGLSVWQTMPERAAPGSSWWADQSCWFTQGTPPHADGQLELLIDGEQSFLAMWLAIRQAQHSVWLVDWAMNIDMPLVRKADRQQVAPANGANGPGYTVYDLLTEASRRVDVRVLVWSGSLLFRPHRIAARLQLQRLRKAAPELQAFLDNHIHFTHCHHQKAAVIDGRVAFVGGLDMADFDTDRWDLSTHPVRSGLNWHDLCLRLEGPPVADVAANFMQRWRAVTGKDLAVAPSDGAQAAEPPPEDSNKDRFRGAPIQVVRTIPPKLFAWAPEGECGIAWAYRQAIKAAQSCIYLENQYLWSEAVVSELIDALKRVTDPNFRIVMVLPARPNIGKRDTDRMVRKLLWADNRKGRVHFFTLYTAGTDKQKGWIYKPIYVHAKVGIVDDQWLTVGSANLNGRGLQSDSEINVQVLDPRVARRLRLRLWAEHLCLPIDTLETLTAAQAIDRLWVPIAESCRVVLDKRRGPLTAMVIPYQPGLMPGDLALGELQAHLLDA